MIGKVVWHLSMEDMKCWEKEFECCFLGNMEGQKIF